MEIPEQSSLNAIYIARLPNADHVASILLLFYPYKSEEESTGDHLKNKITAKNTFQIEGLDDGFYKQFDVYAQYIIDTIFVADNTSDFSKEKIENVALFTSFDESFQQKIEIENTASSVSGGYAIMKIDSIFCFMDSVVFEVKSVNKNTIVISLDMIGSDSEKKRYRMWGENIMATPKRNGNNKQKGK